MYELRMNELVNRQFTLMSRSCADQGCCSLTSQGYKGKLIGFVLIAILSAPKGWFTAM